MKHIVAAIALAAVSGCGLPRDPVDTLGEIRARGEIRVGAIESDPWMRRTSSSSDAQAVGIEADLIRELARRNGVRVRWYWGSPEEHFEALESYELDLVAGGLTDATPWTSRVGTTRPYLKEKSFVGFPPGSVARSDIGGMEIAVTPANALAQLLRERDAVPVPTGEPFESGLPVAAPEWELLAHGYGLSDEPLHESRHVMAVPPGENAWLVAVEGHLFTAKDLVRAKLDEAAR